MKSIIVGIFDRKAQVFISMEPTPAIGVAVRQLREQVNNTKDSPLSKWPADFELYELGEFDNQTGKVTFATNLDGPEYEKRLVCTCDALVNN